MKVLDPNEQVAGSIFTAADILNSGRNASANNNLQVFEKILNLPAMQPILESGAKLIAAYANKISIELQQGTQKAQPAEPAQPEDNCLYGE